MEGHHRPASENQLVAERKDKILSTLKRNTDFIAYPLLAFIVFIAVKIRTANLAGLRDITTGDWTLGPDLDPFLFLRWAKYIVENGSLMVLDTMRYAPIGFDTSYELSLHVYLIHWFHEIASVLGSSSITQSAVIYPVFMFALSVIAFFLMTRAFFINSMTKNQSNAIALIGAFFLSVTPALIPRTIAGIPEKEASGILFLFLAFYFFISAWNAKANIWKYGAALLAGVSTALMGLVWGGYLYIIITIGPAVFISFILGKVTADRKYIYYTWIVSAIALLLLCTNRYSLTELLGSTTNAPCIFVFLLLLFDSLIYNTSLKNYVSRLPWLSKLSRPVISTIVTIVGGIIISSLMFGPTFIIDKIMSLKRFLITTSVDRLNVTVAENRQPYFVEWVTSFGPQVAKIFIFFWAFFVGAILLFYNAVRSLGKKESIVLTTFFTFFLSSIAFSRYSPTSIFNGTNFPSLLFYALGFFSFLFIAGYYYKKHYAASDDFLTKVDSGSIFVLVFFITSLISARGGVRLVMMLVPSVSILAAYLFVKGSLLLSTPKEEPSKRRISAYIFIGIMSLAFIFAGYNFYTTSLTSAEGYIPSIYNQQWQKAMAWVRESTPSNAVFGHWWDYGYWVQSIGERATVLDGGNAKSYWNHMMGRYALTGPNEREALEFLYAHNTTHFLIDSTDIGKYGAFSSIGSNASYDRTSFIVPFNQDSRQTQERKNSTLFIYTGGISLDQDIVYNLNGTLLFLPANRAGLGAILIEKSLEGELMTQPLGIFVYNGNQYTLPLRYAFDGKFEDFGTGIESGVFFLPRVAVSSGNIQIQDDGSILYLSSRTVKSQFARLYLYNEGNSQFKLVHSEDDFLVGQLKTQVPNFTSDFINYDSVRGPIRIWEIDYPEGISFDKKYLSEQWPPELLRV